MVSASDVTAASQPRDEVCITTGRDGDGDDVFGFLVKRVYRIAEGGLCQRLAAAPLRAADEYRGDPQSASPLHEGEIVAYKPATDIVVLGYAHAIGGQAQNCMVGIEIGEHRKLIAVFGDRIATIGESGIAFSEPRPFAKLPLVFERAYGGNGYPRNPVGTGFLPVLQDNCHVALPNFEDPADLLTPERLLPHAPRSWHRQPRPQGMGWFGKAWYPRMSYAGVIPGEVDADQTMPEEALGLVPKDQIALGRQFRLPGWDARFNNGASPGLALSRLRGDEMVTLLNLTPDGRLRFRLPGGPPVILANIGAGESAPPVQLQSVVIEPESLQFSLIWGATLAYPGAAWLPHMRRLSGRAA